MTSETEKLFYKDQYIKEFEGKVLEVTERDGKFHVFLDKTAFFPGGGGQASDLGTLDGKEVIDVIEEGDKIAHILNEKIEEGKVVKGIIDWNRRHDGMQQHLAQHVLSGCFFSMFNANTAGIHLGHDVSTVDIIGNIREDMIKKAEKRANEVIKENHKVNFIMTDREKAQAMGLRRDLATDDNSIRVVQIEDLDINACCGVHPSNTLELQMIKIKGWVPHKGNTRIEFLAGDRAVSYALDRDNILSEICKKLNTADNEAINRINNLNNDYAEVLEEKKKLKNELSKYEVQNLINSAEKSNDFIIISKIYENEDMKYLNKLATSLTEENNRVVLFAVKGKDKANLLFAVSKNLKEKNMGALVKETLALIDGKGGGSPLIAQGGGKNVENLEKAMEYALEKVR
ncbi:MAG: alanyl-tRNA editing protein [Clostridium sp.]|jgi:alanyl-tRNA synthetase|nr:alanyl-tRNA editing protein AlaX-L [Clostridium sp.]